MNKDILKELGVFCRKGTDRYLFLRSWLSHRKIPHKILTTGELKHILITISRGFDSGKNYRKIFIAHYDAYPSSPGANDNAAAVFQLLYLIDKIRLGRFPCHVAFLLTDGEELPPEHSIREQGAFRIGELYRNKSDGKDLFLVFDMTGVGDTFIISTPEEIEKNKALYSRIKPVRESLKNLISPLARSVNLTLPGMYSDDMGFLLNGLPAVQITLLPGSEAALLHSKKIIPETWKTRHCPLDSPEKLMPRSFDLMSSFLLSLSSADFALPLKEKSPAVPPDSGQSPGLSQAPGDPSG